MPRRRVAASASSLLLLLGSFAAAFVRVAPHSPAAVAAAGTYAFVLYV
jgi:hypothetical protein